MTAMGLDFDVGTFCSSLQCIKPPFRCPVDSCQRIYRSHAGIQFHLLNFNHVITMSHPLTPPLSLRADYSSTSGHSNDDVGDDNMSRCFDVDDELAKEVVRIRTPKKSPRKTKIKTNSVSKSKIISTSFKSDLSFKEESSFLDESLQVIDVYDTSGGTGTRNGISKLNICDRIEVVNCESDLLDNDPSSVDKSVVIGGTGNGLVANCNAAVVAKSKSKKPVSSEINLALPTAVFRVAASDDGKIKLSSTETVTSQGHSKIVLDNKIVAELDTRKHFTEDVVEPVKGYLPDGNYIKFEEKSVEEMDEDIEYDLDEEDCVWLDMINSHRTAVNPSIGTVSRETLELAIDRLEKNSFFYARGITRRTPVGPGPSPRRGRPSANKINTSEESISVDEDAVCAVCLDGECHIGNVILFCDLCELAVHQECYGVPLVPDGAWLCRRCLLSPSHAPVCCLCPGTSSGGTGGEAVKRTIDGRWAHVACALWIPEVNFANAVFLEPIDGIHLIPAARMRLVCYICRIRGVGACIQCHRPNCYTAFHVTCAQHAGLYMRGAAPVRELHCADGASVVNASCKAAYCDRHTPVNGIVEAFGGQRKLLPLMNGDEEGGEAGMEEDVIVGGCTETRKQQSEAKIRSHELMKVARRSLAAKRAVPPIVSLPGIPRSRIEWIKSLLHIRAGDDFMQRLLAYWSLKRDAHNGVPVLRRLQSGHITKIRQQCLRISVDKKESTTSTDVGYVVLDPAHDLPGSNRKGIREDSYNDEGQKTSNEQTLQKDDLHDFFNSLGIHTTSTPKRLTKTRSSPKLALSVERPPIHKFPNLEPISAEQRQLFSDLTRTSLEPTPDRPKPVESGGRGSSSKKSENKKLLRIELSPKKYNNISRRRQFMQDKPNGEIKVLNFDEGITESLGNPDQIISSPSKLNDSSSPRSKRVKIDDQASPSSAIISEDIPFSSVCEKSTDDPQIAEPVPLIKPNGLLRLKLPNGSDSIQFMNNSATMHQTFVDPEEAKLKIIRLSKKNKRLREEHLEDLSSLESIGPAIKKSKLSRKKLVILSTGVDICSSDSHLSVEPETNETKVKSINVHNEALEKVTKKIPSSATFTSQNHAAPLTTKHDKIIIKIPYDHQLIDFMQQRKEENGRKPISTVNNDGTQIKVNVKNMKDQQDVAVNDPEIVSEIVVHPKDIQTQALENASDLLTDASTVSAIADDINGQTNNISVIETKIADATSTNNPSDKTKKSIISLLVSLKKPYRQKKQPIVLNNIFTVPPTNAQKLNPPQQDSSKIKWNETVTSSLGEPSVRVNLTGVTWTAVPNHKTMKRSNKKLANKINGRKGTLSTSAAEGVIMKDEVAEGMQTRENVTKTMLDELRYGKELRQSLERVRTLVELVLKRERLKSEQLKLDEIQQNFQLHPLSILLNETLDRLEKKDTNGFFAVPVPVDQVPDYLDVIRSPMDFSTMRTKIESHEYKSVEEFACDFDLIINNCQTYNGHFTVFYRAASRLRNQGDIILWEAQRAEAQVGYEPETGQHLLDRPVFDEKLFGDTGLDLVDKPFETQLSVLEERLQLVSQSATCQRFSAVLKKEIARVRRQIALKESEDAARNPDGSLADSPTKNTRSCHVSDSNTSINQSVTASSSRPSKTNLRTANSSTPRKLSSHLNVPTLFDVSSPITCQSLLLTPPILRSSIPTPNSSPPVLLAKNSENVRSTHLKVSLSIPRDSHPPVLKKRPPFPPVLMAPSRLFTHSSPRRVIRRRSTNRRRSLRPSSSSSPSKSTSTSSCKSDSSSTITPSTPKLYRSSTTPIRSPSRSPIYRQTPPRLTKYTSETVPKLSPLKAKSRPFNLSLILPKESTFFAPIIQGLSPHHVTSPRKAASPRRLSSPRKVTTPRQLSSPRRLSSPRARPSPKTDIKILCSSKLSELSSSSIASPSRSTRSRIQSTDSDVKMNTFEYKRSRRGKARKGLDLGVLSPSSQSQDKSNDTNADVSERTRINSEDILPMIGNVPTFEASLGGIPTNTVVSVSSGSSDDTFEAQINNNFHGTDVTSEAISVPLSDTVDTHFDSDCIFHVAADTSVTSKICEPASTITTTKMTFSDASTAGLVLDSPALMSVAETFTIQSVPEINTFTSVTIIPDTPASQTESAHIWKMNSVSDSIAMSDLLLTQDSLSDTICTETNGSNVVSETSKSDATDHVDKTSAISSDVVKNKASILSSDLNAFMVGSLSCTSVISSVDKSASSQMTTLTTSVISSVSITNVSTTGITEESVANVLLATAEKPSVQSIASEQTINFSAENSTNIRNTCSAVQNNLNTKSNVVCHEEDFLSAGSSIKSSLSVYSDDETKHDRSACGEGRQSATVVLDESFCSVSSENDTTLDVSTVEVSSGEAQDQVSSEEAEDYATREKNSDMTTSLSFSGIYEDSNIKDVTLSYAQPENDVVKKLNDEGFVKTSRRSRTVTNNRKVFDLTADDDIRAVITEDNVQGPLCCSSPVSHHVDFDEQFNSYQTVSIAPVSASSEFETVLPKFIDHIAYLKNGECESILKDRNSKSFESRMGTVNGSDTETSFLEQDLTTMSLDLQQAVLSFPHREHLVGDAAAMDDT